MRARSNPSPSEWWILGIGVVGATVLGFFAFRPAKKAAAGQLTPATMPISGRYLASDGKPAGSRTFNAGVGDAGSAVKMSVGDVLNITLPDGQGARYFSFASNGQAASGYQGLTFKNSTTGGNMIQGSATVTYSYQASASLGSNAVEMVFEQLPIDATGAAIPGAAPLSTVTLWVFVA